MKKIKIETEIEDGLYATVGNKAITKSDIINEIKIILILNNKRYSEEEKKLNEPIKKQTSNTKQVKTTIKDGLYATVGNKAITRSDIVNEIKIILILNNKSYSDDERQKLQQMAIKSIIKRSIKQIAIEKNKN